MSRGLLLRHLVTSEKVSVEKNYFIILFFREIFLQIYLLYTQHAFNLTANSIFITLHVSIFIDDTQTLILNTLAWSFLKAYFQSLVDLSHAIKFIREQRRYQSFIQAIEFLFKKILSFVSLIITL